MFWSLTFPGDKNIKELDHCYKISCATNYNQIICMIEQDPFYTIFIKNSQSVRHSGAYWDIVINLIANRREISRYFFWSDRTRELSYQEVKSYAMQRRGNGGTDTVPVARAIVNHKLSHVIVVSDGKVDGKMVEKTDDVFNLARHHFRIQSAICYLINPTIQVTLMNYSSICPFIRYGESTVYEKWTKTSQLKMLSYREPSERQMSKDLSFINLTNFEAYVEKMENVIIKHNMGRNGFPEMKDQLLILKKRLVYELSNIKTEENYSKMIRLSLEEQNTDSALEYARKMTYEYMSVDLSVDIEKKIGYLVTLCGDLSNRFDMGEIKSNRIKIAPFVAESELDTKIPIDKLTNNIIECPIIMDEDVPQILIDEGEPVLMNFDKSIVDDISACPLRILNYPEVRAKLKARISHYIGTKLNGKLFQNPFTRNKVLGAIPLGNHESHVEVGNYTIAHLISGGKLLGNIHLYFAVIWYLVNQGQIEFLKPVKENLSQHLAYRLRNSYTTASFCGLPMFVTTRVTSDVALWYVVNSGYFNLPTNRDVFRYHIFNMEPMVKMLRVLKYPLHKGVKEHFFRTRAMLKMLFKLKKYNPNFQKGFHTIFKGFYQKGFFVDITKVSLDFWKRQVCAMFIPIDGEADKDQIQKVRDIIPKCCKYLSNEQVYYLSTMLDESKSASDIFLDYNVKITPLPKAQVNWCYGLKEWKDAKVAICPETLRPFTKVGNKRWQQLAMQTYEVDDVADLFSGNRGFTKFVVKYKRLPISADELAIFFYNRYIYMGKKSTLPYLTQRWTHQFMEKYKNAASKSKYPYTPQSMHRISCIQHIPTIQAWEYMYYEDIK